MSYYNSIFILKDAELSYIGSCTGSDTPCYFDDVKIEQDFNDAIKVLTEYNGFWTRDKGFPFVWKSFKTNDWNIVAVFRKKRFWQLFQKVDMYVSMKIDKEDSNYESEFLTFVPIAKINDYDNYYGEELEVPLELLRLTIKVKLPNPKDI